MRSQLFVGLLSPLLVLTPGSFQNQSSTPAVTQPVQVRSAFQFDLSVPPAQAAPLFGPEGERCWAGGNWDPHFVYPQPAHDEQGAVFTVQHGPSTAVWVNALYDLDARHFIYAYFIPGIMVTTIDVRFAPTDANTTEVRVLYTRTALTAEGNGHVTAFTDADKSAAHDWQQAIDASLAFRRR